MIRGLGYNPCPVDAVGTHSLRAVLGASAVVPPPTLDLGMLVQPVKPGGPRCRNQGKRGTCVGFGTTQALANCARQNGYPNFEIPSALAGYVQGRAIEGTMHDTQDGTSIDAAVRGYQVGGYVSESTWPYVESLANSGLKLGVGQKGLLSAGVKSHRIQESDLKAFKESCQTVMASGKGLVGGWMIDDPFELWTPDQGE